MPPCQPVFQVIESGRDGGKTVYGKYCTEHALHKLIPHDFNETWLAKVNLDRPPLVSHYHALGRPVKWLVMYSFDRPFPLLKQKIDQRPHVILNSGHSYNANGEEASVYSWSWVAHFLPTSTGEGLHSEIDHENVLLLHGCKFSLCCRLSLQPLL